MARLKALPSIDIIRGFKGTIDFYLWRGLPCARKWPRRAPGRRTDAEIASSALFGIISSNYRLLAPLVLAAFQEAAKDQPRTARDLYISAVYGHLHEASMTDFLTLLTECRDFLDALQAILDALGSVATDDLLVQVQASALPAGAATLAEQQTQTTALQLIEDLRNALQSVATDRLIVRGEDQLISYAGALHDRYAGVPSGAGGHVQSTAVPAGQIWHVTNLSVVDNTTALTIVSFRLFSGGVEYIIHDYAAAIPATEPTSKPCDLWLDPTDRIRVWLVGSLAGDTCVLSTLGNIMTLET